jgi:hypothetical protein
MNAPSISCMYQPELWTDLKSVAVQLRASRCQEFKRAFMASRRLANQATGTQTVAAELNAGCITRCMRLHSLTADRPHLRAGLIV